MTAPVSLAEVAVVNSTGHRVNVLRRLSVSHDEQIMHALELAGHFVIGTPQGFRYRKHDKRKFTRPARDTVFIVKDDEITATLPGPYFYANYQVIAK